MLSHSYQLVSQTSNITLAISSIIINSNDSDKLSGYYYNKYLKYLKGIKGFEKQNTDNVAVTKYQVVPLTHNRICNYKNKIK